MWELCVTNHIFCDSYYRLLWSSTLEQMFFLPYKSSREAWNLLKTYLVVQARWSSIYVSKYLLDDKRTGGFFHEHNAIQRNLLCRMTFSYTTTGILDGAVCICTVCICILSSRKGNLPFSHKWLRGKVKNILLFLGTDYFCIPSQKCPWIKD